MHTRFFWAALACLVLTALPAFAWDVDGHRTVTLLALDGFELKVRGTPDAQELHWLFKPTPRKEVAYAACEPDRFRAIHSRYLDHCNNPEHYIDVEDLTQFGLTLKTLPHLRNEYIKAMVLAKHEHPERCKPYDPAKDPANQSEWPGMLPYAIVEHHAKLVALFRQYRVLAQLKDPARAFQLSAARSAIIYEMGQLSHFVGDASQPLHSTMHHHGWVGDNPNQYTTARAFHAYIDGTVLALHDLNHDTLAKAIKFDRTANAPDIWQDAIAEIERSHEKVEELYKLQKTGDLDKQPGKDFISERLCDAGATLAAFFEAAWEDSAPSKKDVKEFVKYDTPTPVPTHPAN